MKCDVHFFVGFCKKNEFVTYRGRKILIKRSRQKQRVRFIFESLFRNVLCFIYAWCMICRIRNVYRVCRKGESFESLKCSAWGTRGRDGYMDRRGHKAKRSLNEGSVFYPLYLSDRVYLFDCTFSCHYCILHVPRTVHQILGAYPHFDPTNRYDVLYFVTLSFQCRYVQTHLMSYH